MIEKTLETGMFFCAIVILCAKPLRLAVNNTPKNKIANNFMTTVWPGNLQLV